VLVISRRQKESIVIGDVIEVTVEEIRGDKVRLKIFAPKDMTVHRGDVEIAFRREPLPTSLPIEKVVGPGLEPYQWGGLILSRRKNESIVINGNITVVVVEIRADRVRLGIESPEEIPPHRREVYEAMKRTGKKEE
jgi:carbon storage regulator